MAASWKKVATGPQSHAANLFAVPGSSERARMALQGMSGANRNFAECGAFSGLYGQVYEDATNQGDGERLHMAGFP